MTDGRKGKRREAPHQETDAYGLDGDTSKELTEHWIRLEDALKYVWTCCTKRESLQTHANMREGINDSSSANLQWQKLREVLTMIFARWACVPRTQA
jgi:hypothetical protein